MIESLGSNPSEENEIMDNSIRTFEGGFLFNVEQSFASTILTRIKEERVV